MSDGLGARGGGVREAGGECRTRRGTGAWQPGRAAARASCLSVDAGPCQQIQSHPDWTITASGTLHAVVPGPGRCGSRSFSHARIRGYSRSHATGAASIKEMGKVMAALKTAHGAELDMSRAGPVVKARLGA